MHILSSSSCNVTMPDGFSISRQPRSSINESSAVAVYCTRKYTPRLSTRYTVRDTNRIYCSVYFRVDQPVSLLGVQVPSQVMITSGGSDTYQEDIRVGLEESWGDYTRIAELSFNAAVKYNDLVDIKFPTPVALQVRQKYWIYIDFKSHGQYPRGLCPMTASGSDGDGAEVTLTITGFFNFHDLLRSFIIQELNTGT